MRAVVADDSLITREGLTLLLERAGVKVVATAGDAGALWNAVATHQPDVAIVDIRMPPTYTDEGLRAAARIRTEHPSMAVLVLSHHIDPGYAARVIEQFPERTGYLLKDRLSDIAVLTDALSRLVAGETVIDPTIVARMMRRTRAGDPLANLTARERDVLALLAEGLSNRAISERLLIGERTVEAHVSSVFEKLSLADDQQSHRRVLAVITYLRSAE